jgi:hypothetical protein
MFSMLYFAVASCINDAFSYVTLQKVLPQCKKDVGIYIYIYIYIRSFSTTCAVAQLVETLRYKPAGCGLVSRWLDFFINLILPTVQ